jgi:capsular polysaccharide transport system ATP-binding protein
MIHFDNVWKFNKINGAKVAAVAGVSCLFDRGHNVAVLCDKTRDVELLVGLLVGTDHPDRGRIIRQGRLSWPVGEIPGNKRGMTVVQSLRFIARIYGLNERLLVEYVDELVGLGKKLSEPIGNLDKVRKQSLSYAIVLAVPFDWYILVSAIRTRRGGDENLDMLQTALRNRLSHANAIIITEDADTALQYGNVGILFRNGRFDLAESVEHAVELFG